MYMYIYVCIVCMCLYLSQWYIYPQTCHSVRATVGSVGHTTTYHCVDVCSSPRLVQAVLLPFDSLFESTWLGTRSWPVPPFPFCVLCKTENEIHAYTYGYMHIQANTHTYTSIHANISIYIHIDAYTYIIQSIQTHTCTYIQMCVCVCIVCIYCII